MPINGNNWKTIINFVVCVKLRQDAKKGESIEAQRGSRWILVQDPLEKPHANVHAFFYQF